MKEYKNLTPIVEKYREYTKGPGRRTRRPAELLEEGGLDKDFREMVEEQYRESQEKIDRTARGAEDPAAAQGSQRRQERHHGDPGRCRRRGGSPVCRIR